MAEIVVQITMSSFWTAQCISEMSELGGGDDAGTPQPTCMNRRPSIDMKVVDGRMYIKSLLRPPYLRQISPV